MFHNYVLYHATENTTLTVVSPINATCSHAPRENKRTGRGTEGVGWDSTKVTFSSRRNHNSLSTDARIIPFTRWSGNRPFPSSLLPLFQNESKFETIHMKISFPPQGPCSYKSKSFSHERFRT